LHIGEKSKNKFRQFTRIGNKALGGNSVYVAIAGEVVNRRSVLLRNFVLNGKESASNPLLHIHASRYAFMLKKTGDTRKSFKE